MFWIGLISGIPVGVILGVLAVIEQGNRWFIDRTICWRLYDRANARQEQKKIAKWAKQ